MENIHELVFPGQSCVTVISHLTSDTNKRLAGLKIPFLPHKGL